MKRFILTIAGVAVVLGLVATHALTEEKEPKVDNVKAFMRIKMKLAKEVLEGLVLEDFDRIAKHAQEMSLISQEARWNVIQTPQYLEHSGEFRRATDALTEAAKKKNIDGAALAYVEVTLKCVNCHKYVRRIKVAKADAPDARVLSLRSDSR